MYNRNDPHFDIWLRAFLGIVNAGSLTGGAEAMGISQPTASQYIRHLETALGVQVIRRHGRGVTLTDAGRKLKSQVETAYASVDNAILELSRSEGVIRGRISLASVHTINAYFLSPLISDFSLQRPEARIQVFCRGSSEAVELVERGRADFGLVYDSMVASEELISYKLFTETMTLIHPISIVPPVDEAGCALIDETMRIIGFPEGYALRSLLQRRYGEKLNVTTEVETIDSMLHLVHAGVGSAILPSHILQSLIEPKGLCKTPLAQPAPERDVVAVRRHASNQTKLAQLMEALIHQHATC